MITPRFSLAQTDATLTITIRAPFCSLGELDTCVEENVFVFACKPYLLRLNLPGHIIENERTHSKFDSDSGEFSFTYEKSAIGEHFENLEFITKFLCEKVPVVEGNRLIEIVSADANNAPTEISDEELNVDEFGYGFAMRGGYQFDMVSGEFGGVFDLDPFSVKLSDRTQRRETDEVAAFSSDHYLCDLLESDEIEEIIATKCPWSFLTRDELSAFNAKELDFLKDFTNTQFNLSELQSKYSRNGLLDILYAYCYDKRTTLFESTCESSWTVNKISATLCYFDCFQNPHKAVLSAFRRSLIFPLYRNFDLSSKVLEDMKVVLGLGEIFIIKCLIDLYNMFVDSDSGRYILNNLFIKDYITYIMKWDSEKWAEVVNTIKTMTVTKDELKLGLVIIEGGESDGLEKCIAQLTIHEEAKTARWIQMIMRRNKQPLSAIFTTCLGLIIHFRCTNKSSNTYQL